MTVVYALQMGAVVAKRIWAGGRGEAVFTGGGRSGSFAGASTRVTWSGGGEAWAARPSRGIPMHRSRKITVFFLHRKLEHRIFVIAVNEDDAVVPAIRLEVVLAWKTPGRVPGAVYLDNAKRLASDCCYKDSGDAPVCHPLARILSHFGRPYPLLLSPLKNSGLLPLGYPAPDLCPSTPVGILGLKSNCLLQVVSKFQVFQPRTLPLEIPSCSKSRLAVLPPINALWVLSS
ncbi:hypothetical protein B0H14DRAFT_2627374 [Mycena olivaceomarginata]|nr:hypothetical protein B0H14DRAFT_2627374 [Mycena olivaceomarginata]